MNDRKRRISDIDKLPLEHSQWVHDRVVEGRMDQVDIVAELNKRLLPLSIKPISASALCRWAQLVRNGEVPRPREISGEKPADDLLSGINISIETHAAFKVFLNLYARDIRSGKDAA